MLEVPYSHMKSRRAVERVNEQESRADPFTFCKKLHQLVERVGLFLFGGAGSRRLAQQESNGDLTRFLHGLLRMAN